MRMILAAGALAFAVPASAELACGPRDIIVAKLAGQYDESRVGVGLNPDGSLLEVFASEDGTWTVLLSGPSGASCVVASGEMWQGEPQVTGDPA